MNTISNSGLGDINKLVSLSLNIERLIISNNYLVNSKDKNIINVKTFENRKILISDLKNIIELIPVISSRLEALLDKTISNHAREMTAIEEIKSGSHELYACVAKKEPPKKQEILPQLSTVTLIPITPSINIAARIVQSFANVGNDLCFVQPNEHFAIKIAGILFHGNIGIIYIDEKMPAKLKDCKFSSNCTKMSTCDYYHNPLKYSSSKDCRNYVTNSFMYSAGKNKIRGRKFGSRERLDMDIVNMTAEDVDRYKDQCMHDILCAIILQNAKIQ